jgi:hypothetical protein
MRLRIEQLPEHMQDEGFTFAELWAPLGDFLDEHIRHWCPVCGEDGGSVVGMLLVERDDGSHRVMVNLCHAACVDWSDDTSAIVLTANTCPGTRCTRRARRDSGRCPVHSLANAVLAVATP